MLEGVAGVDWHVASLAQPTQAETSALHTSGSVLDAASNRGSRASHLSHGEIRDGCFQGAGAPDLAGFPEYSSITSVRACWHTAQKGTRSRVNITQSVWGR